MSQNGTINELGTERIGKLLTQYAVPAIIAMTASSLYNMVDSIFIGHGVGPLAISGLAVTFPLMNLAAAFGSLVGVGASTLISVKLGQKDYDTAHKILGNVVVLNLLIGIVFTIVTLAFLDPILYFFGASEATLPYARDYMVTILLGNVVTHMYLGLNSVLRSAGHPQKAMLATIFTVVVNTILDPVFIYGFGWGHDTRPCLHLRFRLGNPRSRHRHHPGTNPVAHLVVQDILQQKRGATLSPGHLPAETGPGGKHHRHRSGPFLHERSVLLHCHPHQQGIEAV